MPTGAQWSFLGGAGSETWILPGAPTAGLMLLGLAAEEIAPGTFVNDEITFTLKGVTGPGAFAAFDLDPFNDPIVWFNSADGISGTDVATVTAGGHADVNWAFSAPGDYTITFEASGISVLNGATTSGNVDYLFRVEAVPEPATGALAGVGALALWWGRRNRRG